MTLETSTKQVFTLNFEGLPLEIRYSPRPFGSSDIEHFEIVTLEPKGSPHQGNRMKISGDNFQ